MLTVEGELDDISAPGQTRAAHKIVSGLPAEKRSDHFQKGVGHYGIFNGRRWREEILPRVRDFILTHDTSGRFEAPVEPSVAASNRGAPTSGRVMPGAAIHAGSRRPTRFWAVFPGYTRRPLSRSNRWTFPGVMAKCRVSPSFSI